MGLAGKNMVVLGATGNVGYGVAIAALAASAHVVLPTRSAAGAASLQRDFAGHNVSIVVADVSDATDADRLASELRAKGRVDHVVASVGAWWAGGAFVDQSADEYEQVRRMLLDAHVHAARALLPTVDADGSYTLITGAGAVAPMPRASLLTVALGGTLALSRVLRFEHRRGARVNELRIAGRVEREARPGVVVASELGEALMTLLDSDVRSAVVPFTTKAGFSVRANLEVAT